MVVGVYLLRGGDSELPLKQLDRDLVKRNQFLRDGWKGAATEQLRGFLGAKTVEEKAGYVVGGESRLPEMRAFYEGREIDDSDTPLAAFIHHDLELPDRTRGIFLMRYERPAQFNIREFFRPVAPLEVQYRVEDPGLLLSSFAMLDHFAMEPVRVMAFFKLEGDELRLDWDVYAQTKYRLLKEYSSFPRPGTSRVFRVIIQEDIPDYLFVDPKLVRYYRISEPSNAEDYVKVPVESSSQLGRALAELNWIGVEVDAVPTRTATVELEWTVGSDPKLRLKDLLCWEFLGLGGGTASASPQGSSSLIRSGAPGSPAPEGDGRPAKTPSP